MKLVKNINLKNGAELFVLEYNDESPLENHKGGELAHTTDKTAFYIHEPILVMHGVAAIEKAINNIL